MSRSAPDPVVTRLGELEPRARRLLIARTALVSVGWLTAMLVAYYLAPWDGGGRSEVGVRVAVSVTLLVGITIWAVVDIVDSSYPALRAVHFLVIVVGLAVVSFASLYVAIAGTDGAAFSESLSRTDALYFSVTTATTVGYGDIHAQSETARVVVMLHMVTNVAVIGIAVRLIAHAARQGNDTR